jgi:hypothetical protein
MNYELKTQDFKKSYKAFFVAAGFSLRAEFIEHKNIGKLKFAATRRPLLFYIGIKRGDFCG